MKKQLVIRLQRAGRISRPFFMIIVTYRAKGPSGAFLAKVGYYDPFMSNKKTGFNSLVIYKDILNYWIKKGAIPNETVRKILF